MNPFLQVYNALLKAFGPQHWWPVASDSPELEVCIGAILTQNTSWQNVEKAMRNLRESRLISVSGIRAVDEKKLAGLIKPAGYYNQKAKKLKNFCGFLADCYGGELQNLFSAFTDLNALRSRLLEINGVGRETADSMVLYAAKKPSFVVDAYTLRVFSRLGLVCEKDSYDAVRKRFMGHLPEDAALFNEYHALIVRLGRGFCRKRPLCGGCPVRRLCNR